jgi:hypothetical protein
MLQTHVAVLLMDDDQRIREHERIAGRSDRRARKQPARAL